MGKKNAQKKRPVGDDDVIPVKIEIKDGGSGVPPLIRIARTFVTVEKGAQNKTHFHYDDTNANFDKWNALISKAIANHTKVTVHLDRSKKKSNGLKMHYLTDKAV